VALGSCTKKLLRLEENDHIWRGEEVKVKDAGTQKKTSLKTNYLHHQDVTAAGGEKKTPECINDIKQRNAEGVILPGDSIPLPSYHLSSIQMEHKFQEKKHLKQKAQLKPKRRAGSPESLSGDLDFPDKIHSNSDWKHRQDS
jgi:hypothetical protein